MNSLDGAISQFVNGPAQHWPAFDQAVVFLSNSDLVKGGVVVGAIWAAWFLVKGDQETNRSALLAAIVGSLFALFLARVLAFCAPLRVRPLLNPALGLRPPTGLPAESNWTSWSSFPSDHAALFIALACGVWWVSRRGGWALLGYIVVAIFLPRLYIGIHYTSDLLAGGVLGATVVALFASEMVRTTLFVPVVRWGDRHPAIFSFALFVLLFQIATLFWDVRVAISLCGFST